MRGDVGPAEEWSAEINTGTGPGFDWVRSQDYNTLHTQALRWLKEKRDVNFTLIRRADGKALIYPVVQREKLARVEVDGDLVTFSDAVCVMKEKLEEETSG